MSNIGTNTRIETIVWWNKLTLDKKKEAVKQWKDANPRYADWDYPLIAMSTNLVERIYIWIHNK